MNLLTRTSNADGSAKVFDTWFIGSPTTLVNATTSTSSTRDVFYNNGKGIRLQDGVAYTLVYDYDFGSSKASYDYYLSQKPIGLGQNGEGDGIGFGVGIGSNPERYEVDAYAQRKSYELYGGLAGHVSYQFTSNSQSGKYPYLAWRPWVLSVKYDPDNYPLTLTITNLALWQGDECVWRPNPRDAFIYLQALQNQITGGTN